MRIEEAAGIRMIDQAAFFKNEKQFFGAAFSLEHLGKVRELTAEGAAT